MPAIITGDFRIANAKVFKSSFSDVNTKYYLTIGRFTPWTNDQVPPIPADTVQQTQFEIWRDMLAAKLVSEGQVTHSIQRYNWTSGTVYEQYGDDDALLRTKKFFVITDANRVYKVLDNAGGAQSSIKPTGNGTSTISLADGYKWKYMFELNSAEITTFLSPKFIPVKTLTSDDGSSQWLVQQAASLSIGTITNCKVVSGGSGYLPSAVFNVTVTGDGTGATARAYTTDSGTISRIELLTAGTGYTWASITINASQGSGAVATASVAPRLGHGADPIAELFGSFVTLTARFDNSENSRLTIANELRKITLLKNPLNIDNQPATAEFIRQYHRASLTAISGTFANDEQITFSNGTSAQVVEYDAANAYLYFTNLVGPALPTSGSFSVTGNTSAATATIASNTIDLPGFAKQTGSVLYVEHRKPVPRAADQSEIAILTMEF